MSPNVKTIRRSGIIFSASILYFSSSAPPALKGEARRTMITIEKAREIKSGETVLDRGTRFIIKDVCVSPEPGRVAFIDIEGRWHGNYHPDEYLGVAQSISSN
jgi:hypothetical protein